MATAREFPLLLFTSTLARSLYSLPFYQYKKTGRICSYFKVTIVTPFSPSPKVPSLKDLTYLHFLR